ncbi:Glutamyl-tRNA(Gln) amidotransferase subunit D [uncultured archaeon]|nr:Glutamyl-tRNA(Gln) amidotransferase subunit D [uncultured archaeon]
MARKKPKVLIIGTGGTIAAKPVNNIFRCGEFPQEEVLKYIPGIEENFEIKTTNLFRVDSADIKPENWLTLANAIYYNLKDYDGIVISSGTNTMSYIATAISFLIQDLNIPIAFTGAIVDPTQVNTDARRNLREAIMVAGNSNIAEVTVVSNEKIIRASKARKMNASEFACFDSIGGEPIGKVERHIFYNNGPYRRRSRSRPKFYRNLETKVCILKTYPGFSGDRIIEAVDGGIKGIVVEGLGVGNLPMIDSGMERAIKYANRKNVAVVISTSCAMGKYWSQIYAPEIGHRFDKMKVIPVFDMLTETAYIKLMWVLGITGNFNEVKRMMQKSYCGEVTEIREQKQRIGAVV